ncbi:MAG: YHS domain-containing protein [Chloroflexi bacterium]|nr:YHS domain-containing protein [Chloroflexota bacterium]
MPKDPVCGKDIDESDARASTGQTAHGASEVDPNMGTRSFHDGQWYYFCTLECRTKFLTAPNTYIG